MSDGYGDKSKGFNLTREQSVDLLVQTCLENGVTDTRQIAYVLATVEHETADFSKSEEGFGRKQAVSNAYHGGEQYYGRGYVQLTHEENYLKLGGKLGLERQLVDSPDLAAEATNAAKVAVIGMRDGDFVSGASLGRYINATHHDHAAYVAARAIINGNDRATDIANMAAEWEARVPGIVERLQREPFVMPAVAATTPPSMRLRQGDGNQDVFEAQQYVTALGMTTAHGRTIQPDGSFGAATREAVQRYQQERLGNVHPDGEIDADLFARLRTDTLAAQPDFKRKTMTDLYGPLKDGQLALNDKGEPVFELRLQLEGLGYLPANSHDPVHSRDPARRHDPFTYETDMQAAVLKYQQDANIRPADGIANDATRARINADAVARGLAPTTEFNRTENWPPQPPPYTQAQYAFELAAPQRQRTHGQQQASDEQHRPQRPDAHPPHPAQPQPVPDLRDPAHPAHAYFNTTLDEVRRMEEGNGLPHGPHSEKVAAALLTGALRNGHGITNVVMEPDGRVRGYHLFSAFEPTRDVIVDPTQAQSVSMAQYADDAARALSPHLTGNAPALVRTREQERALDQLASGDRALFEGLRRATPRHISDDVVAQATLQARHAGIDATDQVSSVTMLGDALHVQGRTPGMRGSVDDVNAPAPSLQDTAQQLQAFNDKQHQRQLTQQQELQHVQGQQRGPVMA